MGNVGRTSLTSGIEILNPLTVPEWDEAIAEHSHGMFFHSAAWARILIDSYGFKPLYFTVREGGKVVMLHPLMEVKSLVTGKRGVSLPFSDECEPLGFDSTTFDHVLDYIEDYGHRENWKYLEMRGGVFDKSPRSSAEFYGHHLLLNGNLEQFHCRLKHSTRNSLKKAARTGVAIRIGNVASDMKDFYDLNCLTRKRHGLPPQPRIFFNHLLHHALAKGQGRVFTATVNAIPAASSICLEFNRKAIIKYAAFDNAFQSFRPNNLMVWEIVKYYKENGFDVLMFGRTDKRNAGLRHFKLGWGLDEKLLRYYKLDLKRSVFVHDSDLLVRGLNKVFRWIPVSVLKGFGRLMYRHAG